MFAAGFTVSKMELAVKFACEKRYTHAHAVFLYRQPLEQMSIFVQSEYNNLGNQPSTVQTCAGAYPPALQWLQDR